MSINFESGRAFALSSLTQDILHNSEDFAKWCGEFVGALKKPAVQQVTRPNITIYTDGSCLGNPGPGGWATVLMIGDYHKEIAGGVPDTTNNRMELTAAIQALSALKKPCNVTLHSDSTNLVHAFARNYIESWVKNDWIKSDKKPVANQDLWAQLVELTKMHNVTFVKVKAHSKDKWNNRCDELAIAAAKAMAVQTKAA